MNQRGALQLLCADDDEAVLDLLRQYMTAFGHAVVAVGNGREAIAAAGGMARLDALILDYEMPGLSALETCSEIRKGWPGLPIILFSGSSRESIAGDVLRMVTVFVNKTRGMQALLRVLGDLPSGVNRREQRLSRRYPVQWRVAVTLPGDGEGQDIVGVTTDLSEGGIGAAIPAEIGADQLVYLSINSMAEPLTSGAQVRHRSGETYGFEFLNLTAAQRALLARSCQELASSTP